MIYKFYIRLTSCNSTEWIDTGFSASNTPMNSMNRYRLAAMLLNYYYQQNDALTPESAVKMFDIRIKLHEDSGKVFAVFSDILCASSCLDQEKLLQAYEDQYGKGQHISPEPVTDFNELMCLLEG